MGAEMRTLKDHFRGPELDDALVSAAQADPQRFVDLYDRYVDPIYRYCYVRLGAKEDAQDATSDVFLNALSGLSKYRGGAFTAWIYRIAHNVVVDGQRRRQPNLPLEVLHDLQSHVLTDEEAIAHLEQQRLRQFVGHLPEDQRAVIELGLAGWPDIRIATALRKTTAAVKKLRFRAVRRLRKGMLESTDEKESQNE